MILVYHVDVVDRARRRCKTIDQAVNHARKFVHLSASEEKRVRRELAAVRVVEYVYGSSVARITPSLEHENYGKG